MRSAVLRYGAVDIQCRMFSRNSQTTLIGRVSLSAGAVLEPEPEPYNGSEQLFLSAVNEIPPINSFSYRCVPAKYTYTLPATHNYNRPL